MARRIAVALAVAVLAPAVALTAGVEVLLGLVAGNLLAASLFARWERRPERRLDRLFWAVTVRPLAGLGPPELDRRLRELSEVALCHPVKGPVRYPVATLRRQLAATAGKPLERLVGPGGLLVQRAALERAAENARRPVPARRTKTSRRRARLDSSERLPKAGRFEAEPQ